MYFCGEVWLFIPNPFLSGALFKRNIYRIYSVIRRSFSFQNNPKDLDPSCKMDLDLWDCLGRVKIGIIAKLHRTDLVI